jgi:oligopeptidase A
MAVTRPFRPPTGIAPAASLSSRVMTETDLLDPIALPDYAALTPATIASALDAAIARHAEVVATVTRERPTDFAAAWLPLERAEAAIDALWSAVSHLRGVADTPELRAAHAAGQEKLVQHSMAVAQNRELYEVLTALEASPAFAALPRQDRVAVEQAVRDFRLAGVALDVEARERFAAISVELSALSTEFGSALLDATDAWTLPIDDAARLAGLSDADKAMFAAAAKAKGQDGWLVTLQQPSVTAVLTFAEDRDLREARVP